MLGSKNPGTIHHNRLGLSKPKLYSDKLVSGKQHTSGSNQCPDPETRAAASFKGKNTKRQFLSLTQSQCNMERRSWGLYMVTPSAYLGVLWFWDSGRLWANQSKGCGALVVYTYLCEGLGAGLQPRFWQLWVIADWDKMVLLLLTRF